MGSHNGDGGITQSEFMFERLDRNHDKITTRAEFSSAAVGHQELQANPRGQPLISQSSPPSLSLRSPSSAQASSVDPKQQAEQKFGAEQHGRPAPARAKIQPRSTELGQSL